MEFPMKFFALVFAIAACVTGKRLRESGQTQLESQKVAVGGGSITAIQWSAHWRCFINADCKTQAKATLGQFLIQQPDFMNLGMYQVDEEVLGNITTPAGYGKQVHWCDRDDVTLLWNSDVWELVGTNFAEKGEQSQTTPEEGTATGVPVYTKTPFLKDKSKGIAVNGLVTGCFGLNNDDNPDRAFIIGFFKRIDSDDYKTVVGAHFPHPPGGTSSAAGASFDAKSPMKQLGMAIKMMKTIVHPLADKVGAKVVIIADTNWDDVPAPFKGLRRSKAMTWHSGDNCGDATEGWVCENDGECVNEICQVMSDKEIGEGEDKQTFLLGPYCPKGLTGIRNGEPANQEQPTKSSKDLWKEMQLPAESSVESKIQATKPMGTCCADQIVPEGRQNVPDLVVEKAGEVFYPFAFDRVLTNFGAIATSMPFKNTAIVTKDDFKKMQVGAQHNPIQAVITY